MAKATGVIASQLQKDADLNGGDFNSRPYYRMFLGLICSLPTNDPTDGTVFGMLTALSNTLALVQVSQHFNHQSQHWTSSHPISRSWRSQAANCCMVAFVCCHAAVHECGRDCSSQMLSEWRHELQPLHVPGFAFAWLDLMSHRNLMPKLLLAPSHKGWPAFQRLLLALLRFLEPYLRNAELTDAVRLLYKVCHHLKWSYVTVAIHVMRPRTASCSSD